MRKKNPVSDIIDAFGGVRPMAAALGEPYPNIVQSWQKLGRIPHYRKPQIVESAKAAGKVLPTDAMRRIFPDRASA